MTADSASTGAVHFFKRAILMRRRTTALVLLLVIAIGAATLSLDDDAPSEVPMSAACREPDRGSHKAAASISDWRTDPAVFIAHGGGGIDGKTYTSSLEAVELSIRRGYRMIELDLQVTTDGYLVAAHDWKSFRQRTGRGPEDINDLPLSIAQFRSKAIDGHYTPLDEEAIRRLFLKHPELILVTDKIRDYPRLVRAFPFQQRVIVEVFSPQDVALAKASGVANPMLSVGNLEASLPLILGQPVRHVALSTNSLQRCPGAARKIIESGRQVFLFTTDDAALMARYVGTHVSAFYSDYWHVKQGRCDGIACPESKAKSDDR
ncbi:MAG: glycerophosphodiester phosphodiesterase family protein [Sulfuritalea sp.]|nr:glycerophosphodiester phosphodiesterase family protein [Sulfuritalea sp.]MDP1984332.1 glycerophosphodiester phosphodiesterase family protein [Sulfuritalea sp.]